VDGLPAVGEGGEEAGFAGASGTDEGFELLAAGGDPF
jgi:hypothetical protein